MNSFNNGNSNLDFNVAQGGIEFLKDNLVPAVWWNDSDGDWSALANWNSGQAPVAPVQGPGQSPRVGPLTLPDVRLPGGNDNVVLDRPNADITITISSGSHTVRKLEAREALNITGGSLTLSYVPSPDSTTYAARLSAPVSLSDTGSLTAHTIQVDAGQTFSVGGQLAFNTLELMPGSSPAQLTVADGAVFEALDGGESFIVSGSGAGTTGRIDLAGMNQAIHVPDGAGNVDVTIGASMVNGTFTKTGLGTLALEATTGYQNDVHVAEGALIINDPFLDDGADVYLTSGAEFDLDFTGAPDVVNAAFIDGQSLAVGTWGAPGTLAMFTHPIFTGSGLLEVTSFTSPPSGDFNNDGAWDCADIDLLTLAAVLGSNDPAFDMNGDGNVNGQDITDAALGWLTVAGANNPDATGGNPFLVGDANLDGTVDGQDFIAWNTHKFTNALAWCKGDFNADGLADGQDFIAWNNNKFTSADGFNAVPEPQLTWLIAIYAAFVAVRSYRH